jgi:hypothetical protein
VQYSTSRLLSFRGMPIACFSTATTYMVRAARIDDAGHRILRLHAPNGRRQRVAAHGRTEPFPKVARRAFVVVAFDTTLGVADLNDLMKMAG